MVLKGKNHSYFRHNCDMSHHHLLWTKWMLMDWTRGHFQVTISILLKSSIDVNFRNYVNRWRARGVVSSAPLIVVGLLLWAD